jgi:hypothetical protein
MKWAIGISVVLLISLVGMYFSECVRNGSPEVSNQQPNQRKSTHPRAAPTSTPSLDPPEAGTTASAASTASEPSRMDRSPAAPLLEALERAYDDPAAKTAALKQSIAKSGVASTRFQRAGGAMRDFLASRVQISDWGCGDAGCFYVMAGDTASTESVVREVHSQLQPSQVTVLVSDGDPNGRMFLLLNSTQGEK